MDGGSGTTAVTTNQRNTLQAPYFHLCFAADGRVPSGIGAAIGFHPTFLVRGCKSRRGG
jgi:hypothetical protein